MSTMDLPKLPKAPTPKNPRGWSATQALVSIVRSRVLLLVVLTRL